MSQPLFVGLLGRVQASTGATAVPVAGRHAQTLLAALLLERGRVLSVDRLIDVVWGEAPPGSARAQMQNKVGALRHFLHGRCQARDVIETQGSGYLIPMDRATLDVDLFDDRVNEAERRFGRGDELAATELLSSALSLWRGSALDGLGSPVLATAADRLNERRVAAQIRRAEIFIRLGRAPAVVGELTELLAQHPWHEHLAGQLMTALALSNRPSEALLVFDRLRRRLADELAVDPGPELSRLRERILGNNLASDVAARHTEPAPPAGTLPATTVPRQLPGDVPLFAGHEAALRRLDALVPTVGGTGPPTPVIAAIEGPAGIGKTTLAVHWAHRVAAHFTDGQLYVNLRGFDRSGSPMSAAEAVRLLLESLQVPAHRVPVGFDAQIGQYRSLLAGRRALVVLDNARDADHVRPLLPGAPGCLTVVTSRHRLAGLVATHGAQLLSLDLVTTDEARRLFTRRVGADRAAAEPAAVEAIVRACAGLPLALAVAAARAVAHRGFPLASLADELRGTRPRLDAFDVGEPDIGVRAVFSWSYRALSPPAAHLFRMLGRHPAPDIATARVGILAGLPAGPARTLLAELASTHLVIEHAPGRYTMHDLLRSYATELAEAPAGGHSSS